MRFGHLAEMFILRGQLMRYNDQFEAFYHHLTFLISLPGHIQL